jgi:hypothetical protein
MVPPDKSFRHRDEQMSSGNGLLQDACVHLPQRPKARSVKPQVETTNASEQTSVRQAHQYISTCSLAPLNVPSGLGG